MRFLFAVIFSFSIFSAQAAEPAVRHMPVIKKAKLLRSNPHRFTAINFAGVHPWDAADDEDIIPQRRYRFELKSDSDNELSDYVAVRLAVARARAMKKYQETWV